MCYYNYIGFRQTFARSYDIHISVRKHAVNPKKRLQKNLNVSASICVFECSLKALLYVLVARSGIAAVYCFDGYRQ